MDTALTDSLSTVADRLKSVMSESSTLKTPYALSNASGVPSITINRILTGKSIDPKPKTISALADALGVSMLWLMLGDKSMQPLSVDALKAERSAYDILTMAKNGELTSDDLHDLLKLARKLCHRPQANN